MPINAPITQTEGRGVHNFTDARGDMNQVLGVDKTEDKWLVQVKSPLGTKVFEIPLSRAADEREATTQVEYLMKNNAKLDVALAEMDGLVGAIAEVGRKVDGLGKKDDEQYKGYTIYPAAGSQFAVGVKGIIQKSKFPSVEAAKKWVDEKEAR